MSLMRVSPIPDDFGVEPGSPARLFEECREAFKPKPNELAYVCSNEEMRLLCQHFVVKVDMTKFNDLHHFYKIFKKRGSLENRSKKSTLRLLMKACRHYKNDLRHVYSEQEIKEILKQDWENRKAHTVRFLHDLRESSAENKQHVTNDETSQVDDDQQLSNECSIIECCPFESDEQNVTIIDAPDYAINIINAMDEMGMRPQIPSSDITGIDCEPTSSNNSLCSLEGEVRDNVLSEEILEDVGTDQLLNSIVSSTSIPIKNVKDYQSFNKGKPVTSTQDSQEH